MESFAYPQRNLPGRAEDWGRAVEAQQRILSKEVRQVSQAWENSARATGGQLAVISTQIDTVTAQQAELSATVEDLSGRSTHSVSPANLQLIQGSAAGESGPVSRTVDLLPPTDAARNSILVGSGRVAWTGTSTGGGIGDSVQVGLEFRQNGTRRWFDMALASSASLFTFSSGETFNLVVPLTVPPTGSSLDIRMWVGATSSNGQTNRGARLENMFFTIIYGDKA